MPRGCRGLVGAGQEVHSAGANTKDSKPLDVTLGENKSQLIHYGGVPIRCKRINLKVLGLYLVARGC